MFILGKAKSQEEMCREIPHLGLSRNQLLASNRSTDPKVNEGLSFLFEHCTDTEITVMALRFGLADGKLHSLEEVAEIFGVTRERIRQIESKVIHLLHRRVYPSTRRKKISEFYD